MLGMYVHTHWGYRHPYAARTWTLADWQGYLTGLRELGFNLVNFWPLIDVMPASPTPGDRAFLERVAAVIDLAHRQHGLKFWITLGPNVMGNQRAEEYNYAERPYFICERKVNPADPAQVQALLAARRWQLEPLRAADGLVIIDSDPGGYIGSTDAEFVALMRAQIGVFRQFNPAAELLYWMWMGWENYNRFWAAASQLPEDQAEPELQAELPTFLNVLAGMREQIAEPWSLLADWKPHVAAARQLGLSNRLMNFNYGLVEGEPSFPLTNYDPTGLRVAFEQQPAGAFPRGTMANAQTACLQLPHIYLFARFAQGDWAPDLRAFAAGLVADAGEPVCAGWEAIAAAPEQQESASRAIRQEVGRPHRLGQYAGLLFGDADRFLIDLADSLDLRASLARLGDSVAEGKPGPIRQAGRLVLERLRPYQQRTGFSDAYLGPLETLLNEPLSRLGDERLEAVLRQFHNWRNPSVRHGLALRLLDALEAFADEL